MPTPQLSPGVITREVDLTVGRAENVLSNVGAFAGPFTTGPIEEIVNVSTEQDLLNFFGRPSSKDSQYEYWMSASSYLSYGGVLKVVRVDGEQLRNAACGFGVTTTNIKIKNFDNYNSNFYDAAVDFAFAAKTPGSWANDLRVCVIDDKCDQIISIQKTELDKLNVPFNQIVGYGITAGFVGSELAGDGTTFEFSGYLKGIVTGIIETSDVSSTSQIEVKIVSRVSNSGEEEFINYLEGSPISSFNGSYFVHFHDNLDNLVSSNGEINNVSIVGFSTILSEADQTYLGIPGSSLSGSGLGATFDVTRNSSGEISSVTVFDSGFGYISGDTITISYTLIGGTSESDNLFLTCTVDSPIVINTVQDWYDNQTLGLDNSLVYWRSIAPKPVTTNYSLNRSGKGDGIHIVVVDEKGSVTGVQGNILEKHLNLSKSFDATSSVNSPQRIYYKDYLANNSSYIYAGANLSSDDDLVNNTFPTVVSFDTNQQYEFAIPSISDGLWGLDAQGITFTSIGSVSYKLIDGFDYGDNGGMQARLGNLNTAYSLFENPQEVELDFLICGPGLMTPLESQAKINQLIAIANSRRDCVAVCSPHKSGVVDVINSTQQTSNIISFFNGVSGSSYAVFDSGYKYMYDRFNNQFRYVPCNADIAGLMARTELLAYPWFSPAGEQRGVLNNAIKLAYSPTKDQRDLLYKARVNPLINQQGIGIILFGDRTAQTFASAFDRINVRRLFLTVEKALENVAQSQLFEFNDAITRSNFVNVVEPYLRDIQAKRGLFDFRVICDGTNNTPDVIDNNEFRADIFLKPTRSINYITLTFVATRTGVSFEEVIGRV